MRGNAGTLHTGHCLIELDSGATAEEVGSTTVYFADLSDEEIQAYVGTGEPAHVAGAFTIDGLGGWFVDRIEGDAGTVIGVSLPVLRRLLVEVGVGVPAALVGWATVESVSFKSIGLSEELHAYLVAHNPPPDPLVAELLAETRDALPAHARMQIAPEQAPFLTFLARLLGARQAVEIGTFTGLSSLSIARGLAPDGRLVCFDVSEEFTAIARRYWDRAGLSDRIELRLGPAAETLKTLPDEPYLDLAFIDADKTGYPTYWEALVPRMRAGGVIVVDNVLQGGRVLSPDGPDAAAIVAFNDMVIADKRVEAVMIPVADGLTLARRR